MEEKPIVCKAIKLESKAMDFLSSNWRHCAALAAGKSVLETRKQQLIDEGLTLDLVKREWMAAYPYRLPPETLPDNGQQALNIAIRDRKWLINSGDYEHFRQVFLEAAS